MTRGKLKPTPIAGYLAYFDSFDPAIRAQVEEKLNCDKCKPMILNAISMFGLGRIQHPESLYAWFCPQHDPTMKKH